MNRAPKFTDLNAKARVQNGGREPRISIDGNARLRKKVTKPTTTVLAAGHTAAKNPCAARSPSSPGSITISRLTEAKRLDPA